MKVYIVLYVSQYKVTNVTFADLQMVNIGLRVLARPVSSSLPKLYQKLGLDYDERVLPSIMNEVRLFIVPLVYRI